MNNDDIQKRIDRSYRFWRQERPDTLPTPKEQGYQAYREEVNLTDNPFPEGSPEHDQWHQGWLDADFDNPRIES